jgi:hypothetical protein
LSITYSGITARAPSTAGSSALGRASNCRPRGARWSWWGPRSCSSRRRRRTSGAAGRSRPPGRPTDDDDIVDRRMDVCHAREVVAHVSVERPLPTNPSARDLVRRLRVVGPHRSQSSLVLRVEQAEQLGGPGCCGKVGRHLGPPGAHGSSRVGLASGSARSRRPGCGRASKPPAVGTMAAPTGGSKRHRS